MQNKGWMEKVGGGKGLIALYSLEDRIFEEKSLPRRHEMSTETNKKPYELPCWWWCRRKNRSDQKKMEEKAEWLANGSTTAALVHKIESRKYRTEIPQFPLGYR